MFGSTSPSTGKVTLRPVPPAADKPHLPSLTSRPVAKQSSLASLTQSLASSRESVAAAFNTTLGFTTHVPASSSSPTSSTTVRLPGSSSTPALLPPLKPDTPPHVEIDYEKLLSLFTHRYTRFNFARHASALHHIARARATGLYLSDLSPLAEVISRVKYILQNLALQSAECTHMPWVELSSADALTNTPTSSSSSTSTADPALYCLPPVPLHWCSCACCLLVEATAELTPAVSALIPLFAFPLLPSPGRNSTPSPASTFTPLLQVLKTCFALSSLSLPSLFPLLAQLACDILHLYVSSLNVAHIISMAPTLSTLLNTRINADGSLAPPATGTAALPPSLTHGIILLIESGAVPALLSALTPSSSSSPSISTPSACQCHTHANAIAPNTDTLSHRFPRVCVCHTSIATAIARVRCSGHFTCTSSSSLSSSSSSHSSSSLTSSSSSVLAASTSSSSLSSTAVSSSLPSSHITQDLLDTLSSFFLSLSALRCAVLPALAPLIAVPALAGVCVHSGIFACLLSVIHDNEEELVDECAESDATNTSTDVDKGDGNADGDVFSLLSHSSPSSSSAFAASSPLHLSLWSSRAAPPLALSLLHTLLHTHTQLFTDPAVALSLLAPRTPTGPHTPSGTVGSDAGNAGHAGGTGRAGKVRGQSQNRENNSNSGMGNPHQADLDTIFPRADPPMLHSPSSSSSGSSSLPLHVPNTPPCSPITPSALFLLSSLARTPNVVPLLVGAWYALAWEGANLQLKQYRNTIFTILLGIACIPAAAASFLTPAIPSPCFFSLSFLYSQLDQARAHARSQVQAPVQVQGQDASSGVSVSRGPSTRANTRPNTSTSTSVFIPSCPADIPRYLLSDAPCLFVLLSPLLSSPAPSPSSSSSSLNRVAGVAVPPNTLTFTSPDADGLRYALLLSAALAHHPPALSLLSSSTLVDVLITFLEVPPPLPPSLLAYLPQDTPLPPLPPSMPSLSSPASPLTHYSAALLLPLQTACLIILAHLAPLLPSSSATAIAPVCRYAGWALSQAQIQTWLQSHARSNGIATNHASAHLPSSPSSATPHCSSSSTSPSKHRTSTLSSTNTSSPSSDHPALSHTLLLTNEFPTSSLSSSSATSPLPSTPLALSPVFSLALSAALALTAPSPAVSSAVLTSIQPIIIAVLNTVCLPASSSSSSSSSSSPSYHLSILATTLSLCAALLRSPTSSFSSATSLSSSSSSSSAMFLSFFVDECLPICLSLLASANISTTYAAHAPALLSLLDTLHIACVAAVSPATMGISESGITHSAYTLEHSGSSHSTLSHSLPSSSSLTSLCSSSPSPAATKLTLLLPALASALFTSLARTPPLALPILSLISTIARAHPPVIPALRHWIAPAPTPGCAPIHLLTSLWRTHARPPRATGDYAWPHSLFYQPASSSLDSVLIASLVALSGVAPSHPYNYQSLSRALPSPTCVCSLSPCRCTSLPCPINLAITPPLANALIRLRSRAFAVTHAPFPIEALTSLLAPLTGNTLPPPYVISHCPSSALCASCRVEWGLYTQSPCPVDTHISLLCVDLLLRLGVLPPLPSLTAQVINVEQLLEHAQYDTMSSDEKYTSGIGGYDAAREDFAAALALAKELDDVALSGNNSESIPDGVSSSGNNGDIPDSRAFSNAYVYETNNNATNTNLHINTTAVATSFVSADANGISGTGPSFNSGKTSPLLASLPDPTVTATDVPVVADMSLKDVIRGHLGNGHTTTHGTSHDSDRVEGDDSANDPRGESRYGSRPNNDVFSASNNNPKNHDRGNYSSEDMIIPGTNLSDDAEEWEKTGVPVTLVQQAELCALAVYHALPLLAACRKAALMHILVFMNTPNVARTQTHTSALTASMHNLATLMTYVAQISYARQQILAECEKAHEADANHTYRLILVRAMQRGASSHVDSRGRQVYGEVVVKTRRTQRGTGTSVGASMGNTTTSKQVVTGKKT